MGFAEISFPPFWARRLAWLGHRSDCEFELARKRRGSWVQVPPSPLVIILEFGTRTQNTLEAIAGQPLVLRERADLP